MPKMMMTEEVAYNCFWNISIQDTMSSKAIRMLNSAFVEIAFRADAPKNNVTMSPSNKYITTMETP